MTNSPPAGGGCFVVPTWWTERAFRLSEISQFTDVPISTLHYWLTLARAGGFAIGEKHGGRILFNCHDLFTLSLLAKLHARHVRVNSTVILSAIAFTTLRGGPRPIPTAGMWTVYDDKATRLEVEAWLVWSAVRAHAAKYFGDAHA